MQIKLWSNFSKKSNSTKRPSDADAVVKDVRLKDNTSIESPTFLVSGNYTTDYNYAQAFGHYYFIDDIVQVTNGVYQISCSQDVLATWKDEILNTSAFVLYSSSNYNSNILDERIGNDGVVYRSSVTDSSLADDFAEDSYILTTISNRGTTRYRITYSELSDIMTYISSNPDVDAVADAFVKKYGSVASAIISCLWIPYKPFGASSTVKVGTLDTGVHGSRLPQLKTFSRTITLNIPWINTDTARHIEETMSLYLPCVGTVELNTSKYIGLSTLSIQVFADVQGGVTYGIENSGGTVDYFSGNVGCAIPVSIFTQGILGSIGGKWGNLMEKLGATTGNAFSNTSMSQATQRLGSVGGNYSNVGTTGNASVGLLVANDNYTIVLTNYSRGYVTSQASLQATNGRPLNQVVNLSLLTGYVQTANASVSLPCLGNDRDTVNSMLNSGIFIE